MLCELGVAQRWSGDFDERREHARRGDRAAARDRRVELRARIELAHLRLFSESVPNSEEVLELAAEAIPIFEELGDDRALGRTWRHVGYVRGGIKGRLAEWQEAAERALVHYRRSGWSASGCLAELGAALFTVPRRWRKPSSAARSFSTRRPIGPDRRTSSCFMGGLEALEGRFDEARDLASTGDRDVRRDR